MPFGAWDNDPLLLVMRRNLSEGFSLGRNFNCENVVWCNLYLDGSGSGPELGDQ